jgi:hypothetical protein
MYFVAGACGAGIARRFSKGGYEWRGVVRGRKKAVRSPSQRRPDQSQRRPDQSTAGRDRSGACPSVQLEEA